VRLFTAILARNEAGPDRYLKRVLERCLTFSDQVLLLDDRSTDATPEIAKGLGCVVRTRKALDSRMWGNESAARQQLWNFALEYATEPDDWVLICDADMELHGDPRPLCETREVNAWSFVLFDMWSETEYRQDQFWQGHLNYRPWLFAPRRVPEDFKPEWPDRGLHVGHFPPNMPLMMGLAPLNEYFWLHWAYSSVKLRAEKKAQYLAKAELLTPFERAHADSITALDPPAGL
jgi:hypothetical protein